jgi:T5SS/PEP-CTERM-associated repeat protein
MIHLLAVLILTGKGSAWTPTSGMIIGGLGLGALSVALGFYVGFFRMESAEPAREQSAG